MKTVKRRVGFFAATVPGSECLTREGQPIGPMSTDERHAAILEDMKWLDEARREVDDVVPGTPWLRQEVT